MAYYWLGMDLLLIKELACWEFRNVVVEMIGVCNRKKSSLTCNDFMMLKIKLEDFIVIPTSSQCRTVMEMKCVYKKSKEN